MYNNINVQTDNHHSFFSNYSITYNPESYVHMMGRNILWFKKLMSLGSQVKKRYHFQMLCVLQFISELEMGKRFGYLVKLQTSRYIQ